MPAKNGKFHSGTNGLWIRSKSSVYDAVILMDAVNTAPTTTTGLYYIYVNSSGQLIYDNGSTTTVLGSAGGAGGTLDSAYDNGASITVDTSQVLFTVTGAINGLNIDKTNTGAGVPLVLGNAGTGDDINCVTTRASSTGVVWDVHHNSASPADADVIFELEVNGEDDGSTKTAYGRIRFLSDDVTEATEDASFQLALFVAGTQRTCLSVVGSTFTIGDNNSAATLTSGGNFDLVLQTGNATTGSMTITDGANGNIQIAPDGTGILDLNSGFDIDASSTETCTITVVGTTGDGLAIDSSTITSGAVVMINHSSAATLNGGQLLDLQIGGTSYYTFGEVAFTVAGTAGSDVISVTAGDLQVTDGSLTIADADDAATLSVTNDTATTASPFVFAGSGAFTGTTTSSFMTLTPSGLTTGTALYIATAAATTLAKVIDITTSTTTGKGITITMTGINTGVGKALEIIADSATTPGNAAGEGVVTISADGLTTGAALNVESLSNEVMTSGHLADFAHSAVGTTVAAKTGQLVRITSSITESGTSTQDFDMLSVVRTSVHDTAGTLTATGSLCYLENVTTETGATLTDTTKGLEIVMGSVGTGDALEITHNATGGRAIDVISAATTATVMLVTAADLTTSGVGLSITNNTSTGLTSGSLIRVNTATAGAVATNGVVSIRATGAYTSTSNVGLLDVQASGLTGAGTVVNIKATAAGQTASNLLNVEAAGYTTGYTGNVVSVTGVSTTGASNLVLLTGANTSAGAMLRFTNNDLTTGVGMIFAHTTSVIADGGSMLRLSSSSVDTGGATNGTILDLGNTGATAATLVKITDTALTTGVALGLALTGVYTGTGLVNISAANTTGVAVLLTVSSMTTGTGLSVTSASADTGAFNVARFAVTNTAATAASPIRTSNVAVNNSKFTKISSHTDGTKTITVWMSQDATTPNGTLSGTAGDICYNGPSNRTFYCTGTTNWTASNA